MRPDEFEHNADWTKTRLPWASKSELDERMMTDSWPEEDRLRFYRAVLSAPSAKHMTKRLRRELESALA